MTVKVALWGVGAMASRMARLVLERDGARIVGAIDRHPDKVGRDLGSVIGGQALGVVVTDDPATALAARPDVVLHATGSFASDVAPEIEQAARAGANVITIAEEMAHPSAASPTLTARLDAVAREQGVTILGTGVNPGFVMDSFVLSLTGVCARVDSLHVSRVNDLSAFGPTVMRTQGVGLSPAAFAQAVGDGAVVGHVGFAQSIGMIARALGWTIDRVEETREPIVSTVARETDHIAITAGQVAGCRHVARAYQDDKPVIVLEHPQQIRPEAEDVETGDAIEIAGEPPISLRITPEVPGGTATAALAVNMIRRVMAAPPGLATMADLPIPTCGTTFSIGRP